MFERFTDRARRVVVLAQEEARMSRYHHIGPEHLLLGLIHEEASEAAAAIARWGISLDDARERIEELIEPEPEEAIGHIPFTTTCKEVLTLTLRESLQLDHYYIGPEHILLGLLREGGSAAVQLLVDFGVDLNELRQQMVAMFAERHADSSLSEEWLGRLTRRARGALVRAQDVARERHHGAVGPEHLLLSFIDDVQNAGAMALERMSISLSGIHQRLDQVVGHGDRPSKGYIPLTKDAERVLELALREVLMLGQQHISTAHLVIAMVHEDESDAAMVLYNWGADLGRLRAIVLAQPNEDDDGAKAEAADRDVRVRAWAERQAASLDGAADVRAALTGLVLLAQGGVPLSGGLLQDIVRVTGGGEPAQHPEVAALRSHPGVRRLRGLRWPPSARVAFAALLTGGMPVDDEWAAPSAPAAVLYDALVDATAGSRAGEAAPGPPAGWLRSAADRVTERTVTLLLIVGSAAAAADPILALRMQHEAPELPVLSAPQRTLLESLAARPPRDVRHHTVSTVPGPGTVGVSRRGKLTSLLPTQLALPPQVLLHRYAERSALYRLHEAETDTPIEPVTLLLDTSPATFGPIEAVLRIVAHAITTTLWSAGQAPLLVCLDRPDLTLPLHRPSDLAAVWTRRSLEPPALAGALARSGPDRHPCVLLTQYHLAEDHGLSGAPHLRLVTTQLGRDEAPPAAGGPYHAHLGPEPTAAQLAAAIRITLTPGGG